jgi:hypothetical protein
MITDTFADGIEAAARVAEEFTSADWIAHDMRAGTFPEQSKPGAAIAERIRALAKVDRVFASAPGGESGWRDIETAPKDGTDILVFCADTKEQFVVYWLGGGIGWVYAQSEFVTFQCKPSFWQPTPAPPGAPPESAGEVDEWKSRALIAEGEVDRLNARVAGLTSRVDEWHGLYVAAEAKCRELEGAKEEGLNAVRYLETKCREYTDRIRELEGAAQAARGALASAIWQINDTVTEADDVGHATLAHLRDDLASLVAVIGGTE